MWLWSWSLCVVTSFMKSFSFSFKINLGQVTHQIKEQCDLAFLKMNLL